MIRKNLIKSLSVVMATMLAVMTVACGQASTDTQVPTAIEQTAEESAIEDSLVSNMAVAGTETEAGKVETVYVTADANGAVNDVIVSEWLKNATASSEIADTTELKNVVNVKGSETFKDNGDGTLTWDAEGSDIYYQGTTDKQLPVTMKITYTLDGKEISPEELAGKSGRVTIRFEYENNAKQTVNVDGKDIEVYTPFAMVSGMMLDSDKFTNVEISNGKVISDGGNYVVMGVALPGLKESLDISDDKWNELDDADEIKEKLSNSFEITADTTDFELGMTITMASSDILSDFGLTDITGSDKIEDLKSDMGELNDGSTKLVDGTKTLKDGTTELRDGTGKLYDGTTELADGTAKLYDGTSQLSDGSGKLYDGTVQLSDGAGKLYDGTGTLKNGTAQLADGSIALRDGIYAYTNGVSQVNDGAAALSQGATSLKNGTAQLKTGAGTLVAGAKQLDGEIGNTMLTLGQLLPGYKQKVAGLSVAMGKIGELTQKKAALEATQKFLESGDPADWNGYVAATLGIDEGTALQMVNGAKATLAAAEAETPVIPAPPTVSAAQSTVGEAQGASAEAATGTAQETAGTTEAGAQQTTETTSVNPEDNLGELELGAEGDTLFPDDADPEVTEPVVIVDEQVPTSAAPEAAEPVVTNETRSFNLTNTSSSYSDDTVVTTQQTSGLSDEQAAQYEALIAQLQAELEATKTELANAQTEAATYKTAAEQAQAAALEAKGEAEKYGALAKQYGEQAKAAADGMLSYYNAANEIRDGVIQLKAGIGAVDNYKYALGKTTAGLDAINEVLGNLGGIDIDPATLETLMSTVEEKAGVLKSGTAALAAGAEQVYNGVDQLDGGAAKLSEGAGTLAAGTKTLVSKNGELNSGAAKLTDGAGQLDGGAAQLVDGAKQLSDGAGQLKDGAGQLDNGVKELLNGAGQLNDGANELNDGAKQLNDGVVKLDDGVQELLDGVIKLDEEGIKKLYEAFDGDLTDFADRMSAIQEAGSSYTSFGGASADENSSVKFIIRTESIKNL